MTRFPPSEKKKNNEISRKTFRGGGMYVCMVFKEPLKLVGATSNIMPKMPPIPTIKPFFRFPIMAELTQLSLSLSLSQTWPLYFVPFGTSFSFPPPPAAALLTASAFSSSFCISTFCCSMLSLNLVCAALGLDSGLDGLSFSRASISEGEKLSIRFGRKGTGVLAREVRN